MRKLIASIALLLAAPAAAQEVHISAVTADDGTRTLSHQIVVPAPVGEVWHAVSTEAGWQEWAVPLARPIPGTDRFETSYDPSAPPGAPNTIEQHWLERDPDVSVKYRTTRTPAGFPDADTYLKVSSRFVLESVDAGHTRVSHFSEGFTADEAGVRLFDFFVQGNRITLEQLHKRFVSGPLDWTAQ